ncbi:MAG TPA: NUDIX domain-containing protein [bacterium]|jgi:ADP-ribose pyrophosphatase YjhB (NUDIX family)
MDWQPRFCSRCGGSLVQQQRDGRSRPVCPDCGHVVYLNPVPSVAAILFREGRVLLVKRNIEPGIGLWCLPGGFIETGETTEQAVVREVQEETGLLCKTLDLVAARSITAGYYGNIIVLCYRAEILEGELCAGEDAADAQYFDITQTPVLAFGVHRRFLELALGHKLPASHD